MSDASDKAGARPMPVTGGCCGIRPSKEAMEVDFGVDFSEARKFLEQNTEQAQDQDESKPSEPPVQSR